MSSFMKFIIILIFINITKWDCFGALASLEPLILKNKHIVSRCHSTIAHSKKMKLISLDWTRPKDPPLSLGHASILANLRAHNIEVEEKAWSVNDSSFHIDQVLDFLFSSPTQTDVALGAFVWNESYIQKIIKTLKLNHFPGRIILGGPQISYVKSKIEHYYPDADVFIRGYAEEALVKFILDNTLYPEIRGVHYANQPSLGLSATADLNQLPSPFLTGILKKQKFMRWETQRGCPFSCSFCQHRESDPSKKRRHFSPLRIQQEIEWIVKDNIVQDLAVLDPTFNSGNHYLHVMAQLIQQKYQGKIALQCRIEMMTEEFLDLIQSLNQTGRVVLEFGLQTIHKQEQAYIQRPNNIKKIKSILNEIQKRNIESEISLIFGLPGQTLQSFKESIDFCKSFNIPTIHAFPLMLLRGTPLYEQKQKLALIESTDVHFNKIPRIQEHIPHVVSSPTFSYEEWLKMGAIAEELEMYNKSLIK